jgi:hypothetical protein
MIVWGGHNGVAPLVSGGRYNPANDTWTPVSTANAPIGRFGSTAVWTGSELIVWGGSPGAPDYGPPVNSGGRYRPSTDTWETTSLTNAPVGRKGHTAVWTGSEMIVAHGYGPPANWPENTNPPVGGRYRPDTDTWTLLPSRFSFGDAGAVWSGSEMIIWGGAINLSSSLPNNSGDAYSIANDRWRRLAGGAPAGRDSPGAVWTGKEMIVWGGKYTTRTYNYYTDNTGGRYDPAADTWRDTSSVGAPEGRHGHSFVWTGTEMIVWGGAPGCSSLPCRPNFNTGGRYDPGFTPEMSIADATAMETHEGTTLLAFDVRLAASSTRVVTVDYATSDGTATAGNDYSSASGLVTFNPGETVRRILIPVLSDNAASETDETLLVTLSNPRAAILLRGQAQGVIQNHDSGSAASPINMYRLYSDKVTYEHFYTSDLNEYDSLGAGYNSSIRIGWLREGIAFKLLSSTGTYNGASGRPLFRLYNSASRQHHWTTDSNEAFVLSGFTDWTYEGIVGYLLPNPINGSATAPLYRLWDGGILHLWTTDQNEFDTLGTMGWKKEGVVGYVIP